MPESPGLRGDARSDLVGYIARDLAWLQGISRARYGHLPLDAREKFERRAEAAVTGFLDWTCTHAPDAVGPLREAGLTIWSHVDGLGPDYGKHSPEGSRK